MSKEETIPREKFVIGEGHYTNLLPLQTRSTAEAFEIVPAVLPVPALVALGSTITVLGFGMAWLLTGKTSTAMVIFIAAFSMLTAIGTVLAIAAVYRSRQKRGCPLRINLKTGQVELPDRNEVFPPDCHFSFVLVESPFYTTSGSVGDSVAELQLLVEQDGQTKRFAIATADSRLTLKPLVDKVHEQVNFPIREVLHRGFIKAKIVQQAYGQDT